MICFIGWRNFLKENSSSKPGRGQRGRTEAEVWAARQWGDRNPPEGCIQLHDRPWQGRGYQPQIHPSTTHSTLFMHTFERSPLQACFFFLNPACTVTVFTVHSFLTLLFLSGSHIRGAFVFPLFIPSPTLFFFCSILLSKVDIFERGALSVWCLTGVAPVAQMHAWAEQKSQVVTSSHLIVFCFSNLYLIFIYVIFFFKYIFFPSCSGLVVKRGLVSTFFPFVFAPSRLPLC